MSEQWTESQKQAIELRGGGILVGAAAGSGKTSVLVERILRLITDENNPVDADRLLVVTFTNAAAAEMSARLHKKLAACVDAQPADRRLRRQLLLLKRAQISTIDAFCSQLVREHWNLLELSPDFAVGSDALAAQLRAAALESVLGELYADEASGFTALADLFGRSRSDNAAAGLIERLYNFETTLAFPSRWEADCLASLESGQPLAQTIPGRYLLDYAQKAVGGAVRLLQEALALCDQDEILSANYAAVLGDDLSFANALAARIASGEWDACAALLRSYAPARLGAKKGADAALRDTAKALREEVKSIFSSLTDNCFCCAEADFEADRALLREPVAALFRSVHLFSDRLFALKKNRRSFEFHDLERMALALLSDSNGAPTPLARELSARFDHILVDEYQDSNEIQDLMFRCLSRGENNLFCVGDVKQSIYSFRRADPEIFLARRAASHPAAQGLFPAFVSLAHNFRSSRAVVDAVNAVFEPIMTPGVGGADYAHGERLVAHGGASSLDPIGMEVMLVREDGEDAEPRAVAGLVARMLREGYPIDDRGTVRPCRESDFCVLLRSVRGRADAYRAAFEQTSVRVWTDGADNLFENSEIAVLVALLSAVDNPRRDVDLTAALLSPLFCFTTDDLARLRLRNRTAPLYTLLLTDKTEKSENFVRKLELFRQKQRLMGADELLRFIVDDLDAELLLCAGDAMRRRRANIRLFLESASEYAAASEGSLSGFLRICARAKESGGNASRAFTPPTDAVCVTSIHKSKGLEWPVVILANADKRFNTSDSRDSAMLFDPALGLGARVRAPIADGTALYSRKTAPYCALSRAAGEKGTGEEMRVLYVALTRARQRIFVTAQSPDPEKAVQAAAALAAGDTLSPYLVSSRTSYLQWILLSLLHTGGSRLAQTLCDAGEAQSGAALLRLAGVSSDSTICAPETRSAPPPDPADVASLRQRLCFTAPRIALSGVPVKLSVTQLTKNSEGGALQKPAFARKSRSAAERGTAMHLFMQCADYRRAHISVKEELARLVAAHFIDPDAAAQIDVSGLEALFASDFGRTVSTARHVLREYAFVDSIPARELADLPDGLADERVLIQGIADCILLEKDHAVLVDYKTDRVSAPQELVDRYSAQLARYKTALDKRLPVPVTESVLYSFALGRPIRLALGEPPLKSDSSAVFVGQ